jgi:DNA modification methylase
MPMQEQISLYGNDLFGDPVQPPSRGIIYDKFTIPPFSVFNTRESFWQERKLNWQKLGIKGEIGREDDLLKNRMGWSTIEKNDGIRRKHTGTSIFDPVLCELIYKWFCPQRGQVIDPFAGGSVRGIVANLLGYKYWGCDLRQEQIDSNYEQAKNICPKNQSKWICGDALDCVPNAPEADFIFSCPPYGDLEKYSDNPRDLSNMDYHAFIFALKRIIMRSCKKLKNNRFACFVVGDFRDKKGHYRNFVSETINAFLEQKLYLYNEAILINPVGSLPIRITRQFLGGRKFGKTHQNILIFIKGDWHNAIKDLN